MLSNPLLIKASIRPNETKMIDGGPGRAAIGTGVSKSRQKWNAQQSAVRSIVWLGLGVLMV